MLQKCLNIFHEGNLWEIFKSSSILFLFKSRYRKQWTWSNKTILERLRIWPQPLLFYFCLPLHSVNVLAVCSFITFNFRLPHGALISGIASFFSEKNSCCYLKRTCCAESARGLQLKPTALKLNVILLSRS